MVLPSAKNVLEPAWGKGAIGQELKAASPGIMLTGIDIREPAYLHRKPADYFFVRDAIKHPPVFDRWDLVITNPPFSLAQDYVETYHDKCKRLVLLLRLNFLAGQRREAFFREYPVACVRVLPKRPSFTGNGTDATEYAWIEWMKGDGKHGAHLSRIPLEYCV